MSADVHRTIEAVWRIESAKLIAGLARIVGDVGIAEELAQDALVAALQQWPESGVPDNPGAWLMATAKHRAIDLLRRRTVLERKTEEIGRQLEIEQDTAGADLDAAIDDEVGDDLLRLVFIACHPILSTEARVALTLRLLGGLTTDEIAHAFLVPEPTVAQRIVRAKRTLTEARVPFEVPEGAELGDPPVVGARSRLPRVQRGLLGDRRRRLDAPGAVRGGAPPRPHPRRARATGARGPRPRRADGDPGVAVACACRPVGRARAAPRSRPRPLGLRSSSVVGSPPSTAPSDSAARSARTRCKPRSRRVTRGRAHRTTPTGRASPRSTTRSRSSMPSPVVELNRGVALAMAFGPAAGLEVVDALTSRAEARRLPPVAERARRPAGRSSAASTRRDSEFQRAGLAHPQRA